jgi:spore germination protein YaaH
MLSRAPLFLLLLIVSCQTITEPDILGDTDPPPASNGLRVLGYHPWWSGEAWREYDFELLDGIYFFSLEVGPDGQIINDRGWPSAWQDLIATARSTDTPIVPSVTILDADTYLRVFTDSTATANLTTELIDLASDVSADGVHLDFEMFDPVTQATRDAVTTMVSELRSGLTARYSEATVTMYMLAEDPADVLDEVALEPYLDRFIVQAYDLHWQSGPVAGPVAPIEGWGGRNWGSILNTFVSYGIDPAKMLFTVPYFGYEWPTVDYLPGSETTGPGMILAYGSGSADLPSARDRAAEYGKLRDASSGSPYYAYRDSLGWHQGWFEDAQSIADKYYFAASQGLGGVAIFPLSYGDPDLLAALSEARALKQFPIAP